MRASASTSPLDPRFALALQAPPIPSPLACHSDVAGCGFPRPRQDGLSLSQGWMPPEDEGLTEAQLLWLLVFRFRTLAVFFEGGGEKARACHKSM